MPSRREDDGVARAFGGSVVTKVLGLVAIAYFVGVWTEGVKSGASAKWLPAPLAYFTQVAALFPGATRHAIDYRVEGFRCRDKQWFEIDHRPFFPIDADNKENRFYRAVHFYGDGHPHRQTMRALDEFITDHHNADLIDSASRGQPGDAIGGVRVVRISIPFGNPGEGAARYERRPLSDYPEDERKDLYYTPESKREERCARSGR